MDQLRFIQTRALQLIDHLTAVSGYCQIVLDTEVEPTIKLHLEKISNSVSKAAQSVQRCLTMVNDIESSDRV